MSLPCLLIEAEVVEVVEVDDDDLLAYSLLIDCCLEGLFDSNSVDDDDDDDLFIEVEEVVAPFS